MQAVQAADALVAAESAGGAAAGVDEGGTVDDAGGDFFSQLGGGVSSQSDKPLHALRAQEKILVHGFAIFFGQLHQGIGRLRLIHQADHRAVREHHTA